MLNFKSRNKVVVKEEHTIINLTNLLIHTPLNQAEVNLVIAEIISLLQLQPKQRKINLQRKKSINHSRNRTLFLSEELQHLMPDT